MLSSVKKPRRIAAAWFLAAIAVYPAATLADTFDVGDLDVPGLVAAIQAANDHPGPDTINLAPDGLYSMLFPYDGVLKNGLPVITDGLTIVGNGATIERNLALNLFPFTIESEPEFTAYDFRVIDATADLTLRNVRIFWGKDRKGEGGNIRISGNASLTLDGVTVLGGIAELGAGIYHNASGTLTLTDTTIAGNQAITDLDAGAGGGVWSAATVAVTATRSTISSNYAAQGGGILTLGPLSITNSIVSDNFGGGIRSLGGLTLTDTTVSNNGRFGVENRAAATLTNCTIRDNTGTGVWNGGAAMTVTNCTINGNAGEEAGGIQNVSGNLTVTASTISDNSGMPAGGILSGGLDAVNSIAVLADNTISNNSGTGVVASGSGSTAITNCAITGNTSPQIAELSGGGVLAYDQPLTITNSRITNNTVTAHSAFQGGGGIMVAAATATITNTDISGNAVQIVEPPPSEPVGVVGGGGILSYLGTVTLHGSTVRDNTSAGGVGGIFGFQGTVTLRDSTVSENTSATGGGIYVVVGELVATNSTISDNTATEPLVDYIAATGGGGGIYASVNSTVTVSSSTITGNTTAAIGGGILNSSVTFEDTFYYATTTLKNTIVADNEPSDCDGDLTVPYFNTRGHNLASDASCSFDDATDLNSTDPMLAGLADDGGPSATNAPLPGSPAINAVPSADCTDANDVAITTDQRGLGRAQGPACDIGAVEWTATGCALTCPMRLISWTAYKTAAPSSDVLGTAIPDQNTLPAPWVVNVDDVHIPDSDADDPENFAVGKSKNLLLPAQSNGEGEPGNPALHYVRYDVKAAKQSAAPAVGGVFPRPAAHIARVWQLENRFGTINVESKKASGLLLPAGLGSMSTPDAPTDSTHYICYKVKAAGDGDQTPGGKFRKDLQAFFADEFADCALLSDGTTTSFAGTDVEGSCLLGLKQPVELCNPMSMSEVEAPRDTQATGILASSTAATKSLLCYKAALAGKLDSADAAALAEGSLGDAILPKQATPAPHTVATDNPLYVTPGGNFPYPVLLDSTKLGTVCVATDVLGVTTAP